MFIFFYFQDYFGVVNYCNLYSQVNFIYLLGEIDPEIHHQCIIFGQYLFAEITLCTYLII